MTFWPILHNVSDPCHLLTFCQVQKREARERAGEKEVVGEREGGEWGREREGVMEGVGEGGECMGEREGGEWGRGMGERGRI